ncbi:type II secretion system protein [Candidatus Saccharibacteria bacterium]|nr:type II secretion system protein [Candidatus Saccharibacteria bacterium]
MFTPVSDMDNQGFTIIEVVLVLAITGLLMLMTFFGQGSIRTQSQFRDSAEAFRASLESIKDQSTTGVAPGQKGCDNTPSSSVSGTNPKCVIYGRVVDFDGGSDIYEVYPVYGDGPGAAMAEFNTTAPVVNPNYVSSLKEEKKLLWGTKFYVTPPDVASRVGFIRHAGNGELDTYIIPKTSYLNQVSSYTDKSKYIINLIGVDCDRAQIIINDPANTIRLEFKDKAC